MDSKTRTLFADLLSKYYAGKAWLDRRMHAGYDITKDSDDYLAKVIMPLAVMFNLQDEAGRKEMDAIMSVEAKRVRWNDGEEAVG